MKWKRGLGGLGTTFLPPSQALMNKPDGKAPLFSASSDVHVQLLVQHRADVNIQDARFLLRNSSHVTIIRV